MTWPAPKRSTYLATVEATTYSWGWTASCPCQLDWSTYATVTAAREAAHSYAVRCPMAKRRLIHSTVNR